ncbi:MAG TPA: hypothetical protein VII99_16000 [Bacteroidia bacterium]
MSAQSGKWALGVSGIYDFQTNGYGDGVRVWFPVNKKLSFSPQVHYFYPFNQIHELYAGLALQYNLFSIRKFVFYPHAAGYYNRWFNYDKFSGPKAKPNNVAEEVGFGVMKKQGCVRPFAEQRYDFKWKEFIIHAGVLIFFGDCIGGGRKHELCPAYSHY